MNLKHNIAMIKSNLFVMFLSTFFILQSAYAVTEEQQKIIDEVESKKESENRQAVLDKYFGAGITANFDFASGGERVRSARVIGGVVRVEESSQAQVGFMLEVHKFITDKPDGKSNTVLGPFIGIVMQNQASIDTAILGWMWGFRQPKSTQTLNLGLGLSVSPRAQVLGDGITVGAPLPNGETEVRYKNITKYGFAFIASFGF